MKIEQKSIEEQEKLKNIQMVCIDFNFCTGAWLPFIEMLLQIWFNFRP